MSPIVGYNDWHLESRRVVTHREHKTVFQYWMPMRHWAYQYCYCMCILGWKIKIIFTNKTRAKNLSRRRTRRSCVSWLPSLHCNHPRHQAVQTLQWTKCGWFSKKLQKEKNLTNVLKTARKLFGWRIRDLLMFGDDVSRQWLNTRSEAHSVTMPSSTSSWAKWHRFKFHSRSNFNIDSLSSHRDCTSSRVNTLHVSWATYCTQPLCTKAVRIPLFLANLHARFGVLQLWRVATLI